jgi:hypothetical protein
MATPKEPCFFAFPYQYGRGTDWYESLFQQTDGKILFGESSTTYTNSVLGEGAAQRIFAYNERMKLIYLFRDPYERIESAWIEWRSDSNWRHKPPSSFSKAVRTFPGLLEASLYYEQTKDYVDLFGRSSIHILDYNRIKEDPVGLLDSCLSFLGADPHQWSTEVAFGRANASIGKKHERRFSEMLQGLGPVQKAYDLVPESLRRILRRFRYDEFKARPTWDRKTRDFASRRIESDFESFTNLLRQHPVSS